MVPILYQILHITQVTKKKHSFVTKCQSKAWVSTPSNRVLYLSVVLYAELGFQSKMKFNTESIKICLFLTLLLTPLQPAVLKEVPHIMLFSLNHSCSSMFSSPVYPVLFLYPKKTGFLASVLSCFINFLGILSQRAARSLCSPPQGDFFAEKTLH